MSSENTEGVRRATPFPALREGRSFPSNGSGLYAGRNSMETLQSSFRQASLHVLQAKISFCFDRRGCWVPDVVMHGWVSTTAVSTEAGKWKVAALYAVMGRTTRRHPLVR